ncbi:hypothetical protein [Ruminococcus sp. YE282]|uniref:hypothetical protein n=1 Tax=Ruminococcus sp. YE282 TaxID=3158780 RepID=UPI000881F346|nr:hypothetical protein SAMN02910441_01196 [Ruminococcus bromii]
MNILIKRVGSINITLYSIIYKLSDILDNLNDIKGDSRDSSFIEFYEAKGILDKLFEENNMNNNLEEMIKDSFDEFEDMLDSINVKIGYIQDDIEKIKNSLSNNTKDSVSNEQST